MKALELVEFIVTILFIWMIWFPIAFIFYWGVMKALIFLHFLDSSEGNAYAIIGGLLFFLTVAFCSVLFLYRKERHFNKTFMLFVLTICLLFLPTLQYEHHPDCYGEGPGYYKTRTTPYGIGIITVFRGGDDCNEFRSSYFITPKNMLTNYKLPFIFIIIETLFIVLAFRKYYPLWRKE